MTKKVYQQLMILEVSDISEDEQETGDSTNLVDNVETEHDKTLSSTNQQLTESTQPSKEGSPGQDSDETGNYTNLPLIDAVTVIIVCFYTQIFLSFRSMNCTGRIVFSGKNF